MRTLALLISFCAAALAQTAPRIISFQAAPSVITAGDEAKLSWQVEGADQVSITDIGVVVPTAGSISLYPTATTTYTLTATNRSGVVTARVTITVEPPLRIAYFRAEPSTLRRGESATLSWQVEGAEQVNITGIGLVVPSGSVIITPPGTTRYTLTATSRTNQIATTLTVTVDAVLPRILHFRASPTTILAGGTSILSWEVADVDRTTITGFASGTSLSTLPPLAGSIPVSPRESTTYVLTAFNSSGSVSASALVSVATAAPDFQSAYPSTVHFLDVLAGAARTQTVELASIPFFNDVRLSIRPEGTPFKLESPATTASSSTVSVSFSPKLPGTYTATLQIDWNRIKVSTVRLQGSSADPASPAITGIANSADATPALSGDSWIALYGQHLATSTRSWTDADFRDGRAPTSLDGVSVAVDGKPAYIAYISPTQINILTPPASAPPESSTLVVTTGARKTNTVLVPATSTLNFISWPGGGKTYVATLRNDGTYAGPAGLLGPGVPVTPATPGEQVIFFLTGLAPEPKPALQDGQFGQAPLSGPPPVITLEARDQSRRRWIAPATYAYRIQPGLYQAGFLIPDAPPGEYTVRCDYSGAATVADYTLTIGAR